MLNNQPRCPATDEQGYRVCKQNSLNAAIKKTHPTREISQPYKNKCCMLSFISGIQGEIKGPEKKRREKKRKEKKRNKERQMTGRQTGRQADRQATRVLGLLRG